MTASHTLRQAEYLRRGIAQLEGVHAERQATLARVAADVAASTARAELLGLTNAALDSLLASASAESLKAIEQTVTYGLQTVFEDRGFSFTFRVGQTRGVQSVEPVLTNAVGIVSEGSILEVFGGGPGTLVAFLLRLIVCHRLGLYPLVLMDETFSMVSIEYLPNLYKLLRELADKLGYTFVLVTQQREAIEHADRVYRAVSSPTGTTFEEVQP